MAQIDDPPPPTPDERLGRINQLADDIDVAVTRLKVALLLGDRVEQRTYGELIELAATEMMDHLEELK